jgi:hypothetical protein
VPLKPLLAAIEPQRPSIELSIAPIEALVQALRARAVMSLDTSIATLHLTVTPFDAALSGLETALEAIVVPARPGRGARQGGEKSSNSQRSKSGQSCLHVVLHCAGLKPRRHKTLARCSSRGGGAAAPPVLTGGPGRAAPG